MFRTFSQSVSDMCDRYSTSSFV
ncbi:predicted protein [Fibroporia radiculosa]|uniref:Uncharacterized protein n=1 Tax=Fibroporia radiculosa TaxID=599839 RepID=J4H4Q0_9APHY|nr:predicted protein [Fibroporia radiculosa]